MPKSLKRISSSWFLVPALGLVLSLFFATFNQVRISLLEPLPGAQPHLSIVAERDVYLQALSRWLTYAALAPAIGLLVSRKPLRRGRVWRRMPIHLAAGLVFAIVHNAAVGLLFSALDLVPGRTGEIIARQMITFFSLDYVIFWSISGAYHVVRYHHDIVYREQLAASLQGRLAEARLDALRAQINPHFLFNTLNSISALAFTGERDRVVQSLSDLSDLLRVSLDRDLPQEIPLRRELAILDRYLDIQRTRFGDRLTIETDVQAAVIDGMVPTMLLQPLVENALQHGISVLPGPGRIWVRARGDGESLCVRVEDTGPGFGPMEDGDGGIGLANTRARLDQLYGNRQRLLCGDRKEGGAYVEIRLPLRLSELDGEGE